MDLFSRKYWDFIWVMTVKEIKARYKKAVFGFLWVILNPVLQMLIIGIIFSFFINIPDYFLFLFSGLLIWNFFSLSLSKSTPSIVYERALLQKAKFPIEVIPFSIIFSNFIHTLISLLLFIPLLIINKSIVFPSVLLIIPALIWILFFTLGVSLITSALNVRYRDINFFVQTILTIWFYATPVLYDLIIVPPGIKAILKINPLTGIFELVHASLTNRGVIEHDILVINLLFSLVLIITGIWLFKKESKNFVDWL